MLRRFRIGPIALLSLLLGGSAVAHAQNVSTAGAGKASGISVDYVRYWRNPATTLVEGLIRVDFKVLGASSAPARVDFLVKDDAARTLHSESWDLAVDAGVVASGAAGEVSTPFTIALAPGNYTVDVRLQHGTALDSTVVPIKAYAAAPALSDLLTSPSIRISMDSSALGPAEMRRGRYVIERDPQVKLYPGNPALSYYVEMYAAAGSGAGDAPQEVSFDIRSPDGSRTLLHTTQAAQVAGAGMPLTGRLNLAGLPPGDYHLVVGLKRAGATEERSAPFTMLPLGSEPRLAAAPPRVSRAAVGDSAVFERYLSPAVMNDSSVSRMVEALLLAPPGPPLAKIARTVPADAQRRLLAQYWNRADPTPGTDRNELFEEYNTRLRTVDRLYTERDTHRSGVHTDRGRIYMKYGAPDEKTSFELQNRHNVEVWKYSRQRGLRFVYLDDTGFGHYRLIYSTDPNEPSLADWQERLDNDATAIRTVLQ